MYVPCSDPQKKKCLVPPLIRSHSDRPRGIFTKQWKCIAKVWFFSILGWNNAVNRFFSVLNPESPY